MITNCNKTNKLLCGCTPAFSSYVNNTNSVLNVGTLTGGSCTFTAYVIEWYRDGVLSLVSGTQNSDPDVTAFHPFTGNAAIPVQGGTWVPVIRWVVVGGQKIYASQVKCRNWCATLTGLPTINVYSLSCSSNNNYTLSYVSTQDYALASRVIRWDISSTTVALSINFTADQVADKIEVFYKETDTLLASWIVGSRFNTNNDSALPYRRAFTSLKFIVELPAYTVGDYVRIVITPSVLEVNTNTNWSVNINCITATNADWATYCAVLTEAHRTMPINTINMIYNETGCRWELKGTLSQVYTMAQQNQLGTYGQVSQGTMQDALASNIRTTGECGIFFRRNTQPGAYQVGGNGICTNSTTSITLSVSGNVATFTIEDPAVYAAYKAHYSTVMATAFGTGYVNDNTNIAYYRFLGFYWFKYATSCGDTGTTAIILTHISASITFDDTAQTITFPVIVPVNNLPTVACNTVKTYIDGQISTAQLNLNNLASYAGTSRAKASNNQPFRGSYTIAVVNSPTDTWGGYQISFIREALPCIPANVCAGFESIFNLYALRGVITDNTDPAGNYEAYWGISPTTYCRTGTWTLIKKVVNGVQTFPV